MLRATSATGRPPSMTKATDCSLYSGVNARRVEPISRSPGKSGQLSRVSTEAGTVQEEQVIAGLDGVEAGQVERLASADGAYQLIGQEVRAADVADLSLMDKVVEGAQRLVDRCFRVISVKLVEVDVVGLQTSQGGLDSGKDVLAGVAGVEARRPRRGEALGGNDETVPLPPEPAAEDLLGNPPGGEIPAQRVGGGGVEEVNTALGRPVENGDSGGLIALQPEGHRPEAQPRNLEAG